VPEAIIAFPESEDYENALRKAVSLGGDSDTLARITGGILPTLSTVISMNLYDIRRLDRPT